MLRSIHSLPPQAKGCFFDQLNGYSYTSIQGKLYRCHPKEGSQLLSVPFFVPKQYSHPQKYLHQLLPIEGSVSINTEGTIATNTTAGATGVSIVRSSRSLCERSCWQFHVPGSLYGIQLGICKVSSNGQINYLPYTFNSSTSRTVTFLVDQLTLKVWVNQNSKKPNKQIQWDLSETYPYAKLTVQGSSVIFNPFAVEPNSKISKTNPFNTLTVKEDVSSSEQKIGRLPKQQNTKLPIEAKITDVRQLDKDTILLISQSSFAKVVKRNLDTNNFQFSQIAQSQNSIWNLFTKAQWALVLKYKNQLQVEDIEWENIAYNIDGVFRLLKNSIILANSSEIVSKNSDYEQLQYLLLSKLAIVRSFRHKDIPNPIYNSEIDRQQHFISHKFFNQNSTPTRLIRSSLVTNNSGWLSLDGSFVQSTRNYILAIKKTQQNSRQYEIKVYHLNDFGLKLVFSNTIGEQDQFSKLPFLQGFNSLEYGFFKESSQSTEIYKILSNCFLTSASPQDYNVFQVKDKDLNQLIEIFKTPQPEAVSALQQTGNVQDALAWLADKNRKQTRRRKVVNQISQNQESSKQIRSSIIQLQNNNLIGKLLLQVENKIYLLGYQPKTFARKYIKKTEKGLMNLSTMQYGLSLDQINGKTFDLGLNHHQLVRLDQLSIPKDQKNSPVFLFRQGEKLFALFDSEGEGLYKNQIQFNQEHIYKQVSSLKLSLDKAHLQEKIHHLQKNMSGQILYLNKISNYAYSQQTVLLYEGNIYSNQSLIDNDELILSADLWVKFNHEQNSEQIESSQQHTQAKFLPLLVQHGPPGCNLNYPICSILYPKSPLPFLANYPYSLTFRHLHSKCMKVKSVIIQRIGQKQNVNEIKEGHIYFVDDADIQSQKYHFEFLNKNELQIEINEKGYWKFMVIDPIYHEGNKLPYQIGFLGAKGQSIQLQQYEGIIRERVEKSLTVSDRATNYKFEITSFQHASNSLYKASINISSQNRNIGDFDIASSSQQYSVKMFTFKLTNPLNNDSCQGQKANEFDLKTSKIIGMGPEEIISLLSRNYSSKQAREKIHFAIFKQISRNEGIKLSQYSQGQIKIFIDMFIGSESLTVKSYERLYERIQQQSPIGSKYLNSLIEDLGKGYLIIPAKYLHSLLGKIISSAEKSSKLTHLILGDLLDQIPKLRNQKYINLQRLYETPYLLLENEYYSKYYYNQIQGITQVSSFSRADKIYKQENVKGYKFATTKDNKYRKIIVRLNNRSSIRNILLRFDKTENSNKAIINVYAWKNNQKYLCSRELVHEHQWIQITKNPYRKEMIQMFNNNHSWLNGYGISLDSRIQTTYIEIQVMFIQSGISPKQFTSSNVLEIVPELFGVSTGPAQPVSWLQQTYFTYQQEQKIFLTKITQKLQIQSQSSIQKPILFSKFLINKPNQNEYQLYQLNDQSTQANSDNVEKIQQFLGQLHQLNFDTSSVPTSVNSLSNIIELYHKIMESLEQGNSPIRLSRKMSLDYCYTVIMWLLEISHKKNIVINSELAKLLLDQIIKVQGGPVRLPCLRAIAKYSDLFLSSLNYIKINLEGEKTTFNSIPSSFIKSNSISITGLQISKAIEQKDRNIAESLMNILIDSAHQNQQSILQTIQLVSLTQTHQKVINYLLKYRQAEKSQKSQQKNRVLFKGEDQKDFSSAITRYLYRSRVPQEKRNILIDRLNPEQLSSLIIILKKLEQPKGQKFSKRFQTDISHLLNKLVNTKDVKSIDLDIVSFIFELGLNFDEQWDYLEKCIRLCPTAQDLIQSQYLSKTREQKEDILQLVNFHRDILISAAKSQKNSQLFANFLAELYFCSKKIFVQVVTSLPQIQSEVAPIHSDIYSLVITILQENCNLGGIEGVKLCTLEQSTWLAVVVRLFKLSNNTFKNEELSQQQVDGILRWYLLNNQYEEYLSNPINRSQSTNNMKLICEYVCKMIKKIGGGTNINKVFEIYTEIKEKVKKDNNRLSKAKHSILSRLQHGVFQLMQSNLEPESLKELLIGSATKRGIAGQILQELEEDQNNASKIASKKEVEKQVNLTDQAQVYLIQGGKSLTPLACKDLESYKNGSKQFIGKIPASAKRFWIKLASQNLIHMSKFLIGFNILDSNEKNNILPDSIQLYAGAASEDMSCVPSGMKKVCNLEVVQDQNYIQFGVKVFAINFDCIRRQYRNTPCNLLELRIKSLAQPSVCDILESNQKIMKNSVFNLSFASILGFKQELQQSLSFSNIYMKLLTFLSGDQYKDTLKSFIQYINKEEGLMQRLIKLLSCKNGKQGRQVQNLLIALNKQGVKVLESLLSEGSVNQQVIDKIIKETLSIQNIDLRLEYLLKQKISEEETSNIIQNIKILDLSTRNAPQRPSSRFSQQKILSIYKRYSEQIKNKAVSQSSKLIKRLISCILTTPSLFNFKVDQLIRTLFTHSEDSQWVAYSVIASFITNSNAGLQLFLKQHVDTASTQFLDSLQSYKANKSYSVEKQLYNISSLLSSLCVFPPIRQRLINNSQKDRINRFPIKLLNLLSNNETLIQQLPTNILKNIINLFQSTCTTIGNETQSCSQQFAGKLIQIMVRLPEVNSAYHNYFIHQFFFHLINAYNGVLVTFSWRGTSDTQFYSRPTQILSKLPIRKNDTIRQFNNQYYRQAGSNQSIFLEKNKIIVFNNKVIAFSFREQQWNIVTFDESEKVDHQITKITENKSALLLHFASNQTKEITSNKSSEIFKVYIHEPQIVSELQRLLTNQTLLRIKKPSLFGNKYHSDLPMVQGILPHLYLLPSEMSVSQMLKQVNLCGYLLSQETRDNISIRVLGGDHSKVDQKEKLSTIFNQQSTQKPIIEFVIESHQLFKNTTIQKISCQSERETSSKFIAQQTIFKSFQKLKGLQKMIKVIMVCVKNWSNQQQSKIWLQYLNQLSSFSCFPIFSSIYMNKQENVELLFNLLSGLPDKQENKKWLEQQKKSVKFLYDIIKNVFEVQGEQAIMVRKYAVESGFYQTMLERLHIITKQPKRSKNLQQEEEEEIEAPLQLTKKPSEEEYKKEIKKKKGIGYGNDSSSNQKWDIVGHETAKKELSEQIIGLFKILEKFLSHPKFKLPAQFLQITYSSAILPILESSLRGGSLLQISKNAQLFKQQLNFIRTIAKNQILVPSLMEIPKIYEPKQSQSVFSLLTTLEGISKIFLNCLTGSVSEKTSEQIAKSIMETFSIVQQAIQQYKSDHIDQQADKKILQLPLTKKYPILLKDLRFDYFDMKDKNGKMKHHYNSNYQAKHSSPPTKTIRLAQELADISQALPIQHTNAIYVRCDKDRVDFMQALIMGSNGTPYGHGAYLFDIYFDDSYPNNPPKVNLTTTGSGAIRFNPNLYACGKVCLSLLGTWRGNATENWDAKVSTLLQVLVSIQSIIMAQQIYFNEPGFEHEQGTVEGEKKNEGYSNIVRYGNVKFAMIENLRNPPKGFETVIKRHFYLKKDEILQQCKKWVKFAEKREAAYTGLVSDHNNNWSNTFKKSKNEYKTMLEKAIGQLEIELNKLPQPSAKDFVKQKKQKTAKKEKRQKKQIKVQKDQNLQQIDVTYDVKNNDSDSKLKQLDINDEKVKDRWSRYIGAMGLQAVSKQSKASILMFGLSALGIQIAKNIVLSGCKRFTVCDDESAEWKDLSGQFYLTQDQIGKNRIQSCLYKLQDLNNYVRVDSAKIDINALEENKLKQYQVVITTVHNDEEIGLLDIYCRKNNIKFIAVKSQGPFGYVFNDFGQKFEVLDKNGEEPVECFIESISNSQKGIVTLMKGQKHSYEDGDEVKIYKVKGMDSKTEEDKSINQTIHKIRVINQNSFEIGDTSGYTEYLGNGLVKNLKVAIDVNFKSYEESLKLLNVDPNLAFYDFAKFGNSKILHHCFRALSIFKKNNKNQYPRPWNWEDACTFQQICTKSVKANDESAEISNAQKSFIYKFSFTCSGSFAPLAAFFGGLIAQEAFKAITSKYMPINQLFLVDFSEIIDDLPKEFDQWKQHVMVKKAYSPKQNRFEGLRSIIGQDLLERIRDCKVFVIGSGAIGCQLLKNYAMINLATSQKADKGTIVVTDPDHIQTSNLNRQFLFRQKHLQKPKSSTAAAVVKQMNRYLKGQNKIRAKLIKVCQATKDTFSNQFFESMDIVTNALDNVQARQYVDMRCVENKVALLESGTLSTKGHVQVIIPYKTQTYGSKADPAEEGDIPHCTLKMFPEQTLHCVQWARDIFGKTFTMKPKAFQKILQSIDTYTPTQSELSVLKDCLEMIKDKPNNFDDAIYVATKQFYKFYRNDIKQLLYTYPLDSKTKDGKDFWKLPKRPPTPIQQVDPQNKLHGEFITSYAVLLSKIFSIPYPKDFRSQERRKQFLLEASKMHFDPFVPSDKLAKQMVTEVEQNKDKKQEDMEEQIKQKQQEAEQTLSYLQIFKQIKLVIEEQKNQGNTLKVAAQQFEKDDDANGHIDLIYSMANLRASNYKLDPMDWITTKLKAGRITPALSTTTSCIAALQTIQLIKYLKNIPIDQMKNSFLNLAVPIIQAGEPGQLQKIKIHSQLTTNIWQRWSIEDVDLNQVTIQQLFKKIEQKYKVSIRTLNIAGGGPIYSHLVMSLESKKEEKEALMRKKLKDVLSEQVNLEQVKKFIDLTLVMAVGQQFIKHVPTIRVNFKK